MRVLESRVLWKIYGTREVVLRNWRKVHNEELHDLYFSPNIVKVIKTRRMRFVGLVACRGE